MKLDKFKDSFGTSWNFAKVSRNEALIIIESLSRQIRTGDINTMRPEILMRYGDSKGEYFSIAIVSDEEVHSEDQTGQAAGLSEAPPG